jgi:hypothetical protein
VTDYASIFAEYGQPNGNGSNNGHQLFPDLPVEALDGRLGEICVNRLAAHFPLAYAWPALLAAASVLVEERTTRTNLYCALVGPIGSGKSQAIEWALKVLGIEEPLLMDILSGSAEQLVRKTKDANGSNRLFSPDELGHMLDKLKIENASYAYVMNRAYYKDRFEVLMGKKEAVLFNCNLSLIGGLPDDRFDKLFDSASTGGLYDRFIFGYTNYFRMKYKPCEELPERVKPARVVIDREVWRTKDRWLENNHEWNPRVVEHCLRAAAICAAFSGRTYLGPEDLEPTFYLVRYQHMLREFLKPNPGENVDGRLAHKFLNYLKKLNGGWIGRRELLMNTRAYDLGPTSADRVFSVMKANGDIETRKNGKKIEVRMAAGEEEEL